MATVKKMIAELTSKIENITDTDTLELLAKLIEKFGEVAEEETAEEDEDVPAPKAKKGKLKVEDEEEPEEDEEDAKPVKKPANKKVASKVKPAAPKKATVADYSEMNMTQLKEIASEYKLDAKKLKLKNAEGYAAMLTRIDKLSKNGPDKYIKLATKHDVDISAGRGRPPLPEKRARQVIVALLNEGHTV